jgi:hypothetical protein
MMRILYVVLILAVVCGCSTVRTDFEKTYTGLDGKSYSIGYHAKSTAAAFAKIEKSNHEWSYSFGNAEKISTGQYAQNIDNTGQIQAAKLVGDILGSAIAAAVPLLSQMATARTNAAAASETPGILDYLAPLLPQLLQFFGSGGAASAEPSLAVPPSIVLTPNPTK